MKGPLSFPRQVLIVLAVAVVVCAYPLSVYGSREMMVAAAGGAVLTTINVLLGYAAIEYAYGKSMTVFMKYVLGGMGLRMMFMAAVVVMFIKVWNYDVAALMTSMVVFYVVFLTLEILYIQKKIQLHQQN